MAKKVSNRIVLEVPKFKAVIGTYVTRITTVQRIGMVMLPSRMGNIEAEVYSVTKTETVKGKLPVTLTEVVTFIPPAILAKYRAYKESKASKVAV